MRGKVILQTHGEDFFPFFVTSFIIGELYADKNVDATNTWFKTDGPHKNGYYPLLWARGEKPPSRPTISTYYNMDVIPEDPGTKLSKLKIFDAEPFRSTILRILETNSGKSFWMSSVYDVPEKKFIENRIVW